MKFKRNLLAFLFILMATCAFADDIGTPCGDEQDPYDNYCPLDSWVYLLVLTPVTVTLGSVIAKTNPDEEEKHDEGNDIV